MQNSSKLKPINWSIIIINSIITIIIFFSFFAIVRAVLTENLADKISGVIYLVISIVLLISWLKTKTILLIPGMLMNLSIAMHFFFHIRTLAILINVILLLIMCYLLYVHFRHHSIYRSILEMAAHTVIDTKNGYTPRSFPVGKSTFSKGELFGFAEYLKKRHIAVHYEESNTIIFVLAEDWFGYLFNLHGGYKNVTKIVFSYDGNVSTSIAKTDYSKYKEALTFDQLCDSLGNMFMEFMQHFQNGDVVKIMKKIK
jgi:hypothetical protein